MKNLLNYRRQADLTPYFLEASFITIAAMVYNTLIFNFIGSEGDKDIFISYFWTLDAV